MTAFYKWFTTFLEEKEIDLSEPVAEGVQAGDIAQFICNSPAEHQRQIKDTLVKIDFVNGDVLHFFRHLAQAVKPEMVEELHDQMIA